MPFEAKISEDVYAQAQELYQTSKLSVREIAEKFEISPSALQTRARRKGWIRDGISPAQSLNKIAKVKLEQRIDRKIESAAVALTERATAFREKAIVTSEKFMDTLDELCDSMRESGTALDPELLQKAISAHKMMIDTGFKVHGLDNEQRITITAELRLPVVDLDEPVEGEVVDVQVLDAAPATTLPVEPSSNAGLISE